MKKILLCAPIHENEQVFELYLKHLRNLEVPGGYELKKCFVLHNCENLSKFLNDNEDYMLYDNKSEYKKDDITHYWKVNNFSDVTYMKNVLLDKAREENFDYIFYVDSDLMLHKKTLVSLLNADKDMIAEIFWTKWDNNNKESVEMPNCWHFDHYQIYQKDLEKWKQKGYYRVGMTGACTLIKRDTFLPSFINWHKIYNLSHSMWEDRAFCTRVAVNNKEIWIDTNYPAVHLYRQQEVEKFLERGGINE